MRHSALGAVTVIAAATAALGPVRLARADEIDDLVRQLNLRATFHGYKAKFHYTQKTFQFPEPKGSQERILRVVMDGDKHVALISDDFIELLAFTPAGARTDLSLREGRYGLDNLRGPTLPTGAFLEQRSRYRPGRATVPQTDHFRGGGTTISLVRALDTSEIKVVHKYDFLVHETFGYVVEGATEVLFKKPPKERQTATTVFCPNTYIPWPTRWVYDRTVFCPDGSKGYLGYASNPIAIDRADRNRQLFTWRDGGFILFLCAKDGWSVCRTRSDGGPAAEMTLDPRNQFHVTIPFVEELPKDKADWETYRAVHRLFGVPPELADHVRQKAEWMNLGVSAPLCRIGMTEDFEEQPVPVNEAVRGLAWTQNPPAVSMEAARSGKKSLLFRGRWGANDPVVALRSDTPPVPLRPGAKYRLEAWVKVESMTQDERLLFRQAYDESVAKLQAENAALPRDQKKPIPPYSGPKPFAEAYLAANLYESDPPDGRCVARQQTNVAKANTTDWQKLSLEFTTPEWDPLLEVIFVVDSGQVFVDDFTLMRAD